jgi:hypothetical protein
MKRGRDPSSDDPLPVAKSLAVDKEEDGSAIPPHLPGDMWCLVAQWGDILEQVGDADMPRGMATYLLGHVCRAIRAALATSRKQIQYRPGCVPWLVKYQTPMILVGGLEAKVDHDCLPYLAIRCDLFDLAWMLRSHKYPAWFWRWTACGYGRVDLMRAIEFDAGVEWSDPLLTIRFCLMAVKNEDIELVTYFIEESKAPLDDPGQWLADAIAERPVLFARLDPIGNTLGAFPPHRRELRSQIIMKWYAAEMTRRAKPAVLPTKTLN